MSSVARLALPGVLLLTLVAGRAASAADPVAQIQAQHKTFLDAYEKGETARMKGAVSKAVSIGEKAGLADKPEGKAVMADTYVLAAIFEADGNENKAAAVKAFVKALKLKPDVAIPQGMGTSTVKVALKEARAQTGGAPPGPAPAAEPKAAVAQDDKKDDKKGDKTDDKTDEKSTERVDKNEKSEKNEKPEKNEKADKAADKAATDKQAAADKTAADKQAAADKARADGEAKQQKELADKQARESRDREAKTKVDHDRQVADATARAAQLEKDKADRDKQLAAATARAAQLEKDKADRDRQITELKARVAQLERERVERENVLAEAKAQSTKEREAREKVERERQAAAAEAKVAQEKRESLLAGPELPKNLPEPLHCAIPDDAPWRTDLYVHCAVRANVKAKTLVFYYRAGGAHYTSVTLDRNAKGWYVAVIPGVRVVGKSMQYYVQAFDAREGVAAANGKESSPNVLMLHAPTPPRG